MKKLLLSVLMLTSCAGQVETCSEFDSYIPVDSDGVQAAWTMTLVNDHSVGGCYYYGPVLWDNGTSQRELTEQSIEFDLNGRMTHASDICPDGPCGEKWSNWSMWEPVITEL